MENVTEKYSNMIQSFADDCDLAVQGKRKFAELDGLINDANFRYDIELLNELAFLIRYNKVRIFTMPEE